MNPLLLLHPGTWLAVIAALGLLTGGAAWWGHTKYQAGVHDERAVWETKQREADAAQEATRKIQFRQAELTTKQFEQKAETRKVEDASRQTVVADLQRDVDLLRWALERRSREAQAAPTDSCSADRGRIRVVEGLLGESQSVVARCAGLVSEGAAGVSRLADKLGLAVESLKIDRLGEQ